MGGGGMNCTFYESGMLGLFLPDPFWDWFSFDDFNQNAVGSEDEKALQFMVLPRGNRLHDGDAGVFHPMEYGFDISV